MTTRKKGTAKAFISAEVPPEAKPESPEISSVETELPVTDEKPAADFPVVGIGASAGGLAAFEAFFPACRPETNRAWRLFLCSIWPLATRASSPT